MNKKAIVFFNKKSVYVGSSKHGYGLTYLAKREFDHGEVVMESTGKIINHQTPHISVQIGENRHFLPSKWTSKYWNHSCEPNTHIKTRSDNFPSLVASKK